MANLTFDKERITLNLARLKKGGENFEVAVDADLAIDYKKGKIIDIREVLKSEEIFFDAKKGLLASDSRMKEVFETDNTLEVAAIILKSGEIQLTAEYRQKLRDEKMKRIISIIHQNGVDPKTGLPLPVIRIENAMNDAKIHVDEFMPAEDQVDSIVVKLRPIIPIKFEKKKIQIHIPATYAPKCYSAVKNYGNMTNEDWMNDGSWQCTIEIAAGLLQEFYDKLNSLTHGEVETKEI